MHPILRRLGRIRRRVTRLGALLMFAVTMGSSVSAEVITLTSGFLNVTITPDSDRLPLSCGSKGSCMATSSTCAM